MIKIFNAFSINMLPSTEIRTVKAEFREISEEEVKKILASGFKSYIGHKDLASVLTERLNTLILENRETVRLKRGETVLVTQYIGERLPEGATKLPEGANISYFLVEVK